MSTHNIQFHDKIRKFPLVFVFLSYRKNFVGTQKRVRINHDKPLVFELLRFDCIRITTFLVRIISVSEMILETVYQYLIKFSIFTSSTRKKST